MLRLKILLISHREIKKTIHLFQTPLATVSADGALEDEVYRLRHLIGTLERLVKDGFDSDGSIQTIIREKKTDMQKALMKLFAVSYY
jgi:hypothetical protein